jgi:hypothetical protein
MMHAALQLQLRPLFSDRQQFLRAVYIAVSTHGTLDLGDFVLRRFVELGGVNEAEEGVWMRGYRGASTVWGSLAVRLVAADDEGLEALGAGWQAVLGVVEEGGLWDLGSMLTVLVGD